MIVAADNIAPTTESAPFNSPQSDAYNNAEDLNEDDAILYSAPSNISDFSVGDLTTGLLSLNVHEPLTFNGTKVALHPELFSSFGPMVASALKEKIKKQEEMQLEQKSLKSNHRAFSGDSKQTVLDNTERVNQFVESASIGSPKPTIQTNIPLIQVGDFIEIRVWDPIDDDLSAHFTEEFELVKEKLSPPSEEEKEKATSAKNSFDELDSVHSDSAPKTVREVLQVGAIMRFLSDGSHPISANSKLSDLVEAPACITRIGASKPYRLRTRFIMSVGEHALTCIKESSRSQVSVLKQVADLYSLSAYDMVTITKIDPKFRDIVMKEVSADFVMVTIKDQFISRGEMFHYQSTLLGKWVFVGERLVNKDGVRAVAKEIRHGDKSVKSGIVTKDTKITFRSRSARIIWLVQISTEMWDYASPHKNVSSLSGPQCQLYFDKFVSIMRRLFEKWKELEVTHSLSIIFFSRSFLSRSRGKRPEIVNDVLSAGMNLESDGRAYRDHYKVVVENESRTDWETLIVQVKKAFVQYPKHVGWSLSADGESCIPSTAAQGNVLEAINVALNVLQLHYMDRDLHRTGNSVVVVSAGNGVFEVDKKVAGITKQRMMDNGIGSDMLSLGLPPLHVAPFFLYKEAAGTSEEERVGFENWKTFFEIPHWMHLSFAEYDDEFYGRQITEDQVTDCVPKVHTNGLVQICEDGNYSARASSPENALKNVDGGSMHQRDLISSRDFEDVLEACRPRDRAYYDDFAFQLPSALKSLIGIKSSKSNFGPRNLASTATEKEVYRTLPEWGHVDFRTRLLKGGSFQHKLHRSADLQNADMLGTSRGSSILASSESSQTCHPLSWIMRSGEAADRQIVGDDLSGYLIELGLQIQKSMSVESPSRVCMSSHPRVQFSASQSQSAVKPGDDECKEQDKVDILRKMMAFYDASATSAAHAPEIRSLSRGDMLTSETPEGFTAKKPAPSSDQKGGGIGAALQGSNALHHGPAPYGKMRRTLSSKAFRGSNIVSRNTVGSSSLTRLQNASNKTVPVTSNRLRPMPVAIEPPDAVYQTTSSDVHDATLKAESSLANESTNLNVAPLGTSPQAVYIRPSIKKIQYGSPISRGPTNISRIFSSVQSKDAFNRLENIGKTPKSAFTKSKENKFSWAGSLAQEVNERKKEGKKVPLRRKPWVLNPFRLQEEEEMLAKRTHNRRRWSHVFPPGEIEFKRQSGPNWKSLCQPAVLPLTTDFHPEEYELNDQSKYEFSHYSIFIDALDLSYYKSLDELLMEMVIQRIIQDYQIVPDAVVEESQQRSEARRKALLSGKQDSRNSKNRPGILNQSRPTIFSKPVKKSLSAENGTKKELILSMGHNVHKLICNPQNGEIVVVQYHAKFAQNDDSNTYSYNYLLWMPISQSFQSVTQTFLKFGILYRWNNLDNLICGDPQKVLSEGFRYRRLEFCLIPDSFTDPEKEFEYIQRCFKLLDYIGKLQQKQDTLSMDVKLHTIFFQPNDISGAFHGEEPVKHLNIQLRKGTRDKYEWLELVLDEVLDTKRTYRIGFRWLVASGSKVEAQLQSLLRRASHFGLALVPCPQYATSSILYLHPFVAPVLLPSLSGPIGCSVESSLVNSLGYVYDGIRWAEPSDFDCKGAFEFPTNKRGKRRRLLGRHYIHKTGLAFIRVLQDDKENYLIFWVKNRLQIGQNDELDSQTSELFFRLVSSVETEKVKERTEMMVQP